MSDYQVDKIEVHVSLFLVNGSVMRGWVYLSADAPYRTGGQTVGDLMRESEPMFPVRDKAGRFALVGRSGVAAVEVEKDRRHVDDATTLIPAHVEMLGGHRFSGRFLIQHGTGTRVSDVVNDGDVWMRFDTGVALVWLAREQILTARPEDLPVARAG